MPTKSVSKPKKLDLTISIVSYNTKRLLKRCLKSIFKHTQGLSFELIVVDNASQDGSAQMVRKNFPQVRLIVNKTNRFYTGANNQALRQARSEYFLILNSDIYLKNNAFKTLLDYLKTHPGAAAAEPLQLYEDGRLVPTGSKHNSTWLDFIELTVFGRLIKYFFPKLKKHLADFRLISQSRRKTFAAEVICDAAFMVRTVLLKKIRGYDENFKLYYTENDLCQRLQALGLTTVHLAKARVWHTVSASTTKAGWKKISPVYAHDAFVYYKKYHSWPVALSLFFCLKLNNWLVRLKQSLPIIFLILLASFLRFYRLPETMSFIGDQGRDYLAARDMLLTGSWPLVGIASSVPWLKQGPVFIWLIALALKLGHWHPLAPAILTATLGVVAVYLVYRLSRNWWAALILATSPLAVVQSRLAYHTSPIPLLATLYLGALFSGAIGWAWFLAGLLLQFELTTLALVLVLILKFWRQKLRLLLTFPAFLVPFLPKIIYDAGHGWEQTAGFLAWTGYRLLAFFGFGGEHTVSGQSLAMVSATIFEFWTKFISWGQPLISALVGLSVVVFLPRAPRLLTGFLGLVLLSFYIHAGPSEAYFPVLFPVWSLLIGFLLKKFNRWWLYCLIIALAFYNSLFLFQKDFQTYGPALGQRLSLAKLIKLQAGSRAVKLENYPGIPFAAYLDNYRYLLWWLGVKQSDEANLIYQIYDGPDDKFIQLLGTTVYHFSNQKLIKYD